MDLQNIANEIFLRIEKIDKRGMTGIILESVSAMPGQGVTGMFSFGQSLWCYQRSVCSSATSSASC
jgi:crossover junction endodeoxyribonuclease RuvC